MKAVEVIAVVTMRADDEKLLRAAGLSPVVRWVDVLDRSDVGLKTTDAVAAVLKRGKKGKAK